MTPPTTSPKSRWQSVRARASKLNKRFERHVEDITTYLVRTSAAVVGMWAVFEAWAAYSLLKQHQASALASGKIDQWGQYGDYLGGVVGTYAAVVSACLLVVTFHAQYLALEHAKQHSILSEYQRVIAEAKVAVDRALAEPFAAGADFPYMVPKGGHDVFGMCNVLWGVATSVPAFPPNYGKALFEHEGFRRAQIHFYHLVYALSQFKARGGDPSVAMLYSSAYGAQLVVFSALWPAKRSIDYFEVLGAEAEFRKQAEALQQKLIAAGLPTTGSI